MSSATDRCAIRRWAESADVSPVVRHGSSVALADSDDRSCAGEPTTVTAKLVTVSFPA